jgi:uncharacterized DUF497 family protein
VGSEEGGVEPGEARRCVRRGVHGVRDPLAFVTEDANHPERSLITGLSVASRVLVTVFIETVADDNGEEIIRIISARLATKRERRRYEEGEES